MCLLAVEFGGVASFIYPKLLSTFLGMLRHVLFTQARNRRWQWPIAVQAAPPGPADDLKPLGGGNIHVYMYMYMFQHVYKYKDLNMYIYIYIYTSSIYIYIVLPIAYRQVCARVWVPVLLPKPSSTSPTWSNTALILSGPWRPGTGGYDRQSLVNRQSIDNRYN